MNKPLFMKLFFILAAFLYSSYSFSSTALSREDAFRQCNIVKNSQETCQDGNGTSTVILKNTINNGTYNTWFYPAGRDCTDTTKVYNSTTHICENPQTCSDGSVIPSSQSCPVNCVAGSTKTILVTDADFPSNTAPTYRIHNHQVVTDNPTATIGHCEYSLPRSGYHNCNKAGAIQYCSVLATATGAIDSGGDTAVDPTTLPPQTASDCGPGTTFVDSRCIVDKADNDCLRTTNGDQICNAHPKKNCGTVNGVEVCVSPDGTTTPTLNGNSTTNANANGQNNNCLHTPDGSVVCINTPTVPKSSCGFPFVCLQPETTKSSPSTNTTQLDKNVESVTSTTTSQNQLGGTTTVETTTQNIIDSEPVIKTVVRDANGNIVSTTYTGGSGQLSTDSSGKPIVPGNTQTQFDGNVSDSGTHTLLETIKGILNGIGTAITSIKDAIIGQGITPTQPTDDLDTIFSDGETQAQNALGSATGYITSTINLPATGSCDFPAIVFKGHLSTFDLCSKLAKLKEYLGWILYIITFISVVEIATKGSS